MVIGSSLLRIMSRDNGTMDFPGCEKRQKKVAGAKAGGAFHDSSLGVIGDGVAPFQERGRIVRLHQVLQSSKGPTLLQQNLHSTFDQGGAGNFALGSARLKM